VAISGKDDEAERRETAIMGRISRKQASKKPAAKKRIPLCRTEVFGEKGGASAEKRGVLTVKAEAMHSKHKSQREKANGDTIKKAPGNQ